MTAPIFFNVTEARLQLRVYGICYTLRKPRGHGRTRARHGTLYKFKDLGPVDIMLVADNAGTATLHHYLPGSGFQSVEAWRKAAGPQATHLYCVRKIMRGED